jgi:sigma-B regulation protein RsbU (phosphoserine phosphatase)
VFGVFHDCGYTQGEIELQSGDSLVLFTDGITEARNPSGREFGEERLQALLTTAHKQSAADLRDLITNAVSEFSEGEVYDDATLMIVTVV